MKKRFCRLGRMCAGALCLVSVCGAMYSCADEYELDDGTPSWLNSSIYDYLQSSGKYTNFVKLIDDMDYAEVLDKTGSKTLFVADDDAFAEFYKDNPWGVASYDELTISQKKLLMNSAMINNAYLLEMMSSTADNSDAGSEPQKGKCLRRNTAATVTDYVPYFKGEDLPKTYNANDKDYWARFREAGTSGEARGIHLALDASDPMMVHFLEAQMMASNITNEDFKVIMGVERQPNDAYIFDSKVVESDIRCLNGYVNRLDKVLVTPQNMAEVLRTNGKTNVFSHMVDRFSAPFYNEDLTARYKLVYGDESVDSIFEKRYFSSNSRGNVALRSDKGTDPISDPVGSEVNYFLNFDPGWNGYVNTGRDTSADEDMGVMFAPTDQALYDYFFSTGGNGGGGRFLIEAYAPDCTPPANAYDYENFYNVIDQIPINVIQALINNLMKPSFKNAVPSKFITNVKNDAQDPMLTEEDMQYISKVEIANNGIIYLMDEKVITPAQYSAVSAPAYVSTDMRIFNWAIQRGSSSASAALTEKLGPVVVNYYAYLLAMSSRFSFFVPKDDNFWYVDPVSFKNPKTTANSTVLTGRIINYVWNEEKGKPECTAYNYEYDIATGVGQIGSKLTTSSLAQMEWGDRLRDMLETHTIVHEDSSATGIIETETGIECDKHYFLTKNNAPVYIKTPYNSSAARREGMEIQGGWELQHDSVRTVTRFDNKTNGGNGMAYQIDQPIKPTLESVYSTLYDGKDGEFGEFFNLCQTDGAVLEEIGITSNAEQERYMIFVDDGGLPCYDKQTGLRVAAETNVRFFNNYNYTVYVPTNEAIREAIANGLPTWESISEFLELNLEPEDRTDYTEEELVARNEKALLMVTTLVNFVKYHFQDRSVFADKPRLAPTVYETATINSESGIYCKVTVSSDGNETLSVTDATGVKRNITADKNLLTRDYVIRSAKENSKDYDIVSTSSFAVVHGIDGVLNYKSYKDGRYDSEWATPSAAKKYLAKYRITK